MCSRHLAWQPVHDVAFSFTCLTSRLPSSSSLGEDHTPPTEPSSEEASTQRSQCGRASPSFYFFKRISALCLMCKVACWRRQSAQTASLQPPASSFVLLQHRWLKRLQFSQQPLCHLWPKQLKQTNSSVLIMNLQDDNMLEY